MSVHGEYGRALRGVLEQLDECNGLVARDGRNSLDAAHTSPVQDLSTAARRALAGLDRVEADLTDAAGRVEAARHAGADRLRLERLRDACHHLRAHCHAILGVGSPDR